MGFGINAPGVSSAFPTPPNGVSLGRALNLPEPEWLPPLSRQIFTEHCPRHQKGPGHVPAPTEARLCLTIGGGDICPVGVAGGRFIRVVVSLAGGRE